MLYSKDGLRGFFVTHLKTALHCISVWTYNVSAYENCSNVSTTHGVSTMATPKWGFQSDYSLIILVYELPIFCREKKKKKDDTCF